MSDTNEVYVDIPYITEEYPEERRSSKCDSVIEPWSNSDSPSPYSSFREVGALLTRKHTVPFVFVSTQPYRTVSLTDIRAECCACPPIARHGYNRRSNYTELSRHSSKRKGSTSSERRSSFKSSVRSNRSRKSLDRTKSVRSNYSRKISYVQPLEKTKEELKKEKRHRIAVWFIFGSFIFIALSAILVVIVTLTHQSEHKPDNNSSTYYYTFAKPYYVASGDDNSKNVRRENEELLNSLQSGYNSTSLHASPP